jgi:general secretion pathway protein G
MRRNRNQGFTLIELMVVITILGLLASVTAVGVMSHLRTAKVETTKTSMRAIKEAIKLYYMKKNRIPQSLAEMCGPPDTDPPLDREEPPKDAWGNDFLYSPRDKRNYDLMSFGADGVEGGEKDDQDITLADLDRRSDEDK